jgi:2-hydroxychromene-2-carboxylate isomerase
MTRVEFHFDFGSPNAYLAHMVIPDIERRTGARFEYVPVLLGGVFKLTGNRSPAEAFAGIKNKPEYERLETERFLRRHAITGYRRNPFFPVNTLTLMRGAIAAQSLGVFERYVDESTGICGRSRRSSTTLRCGGPCCWRRGLMRRASRRWCRTPKSSSA